MSKHIIWMIVGCTLPLLLIFFAPALGLSGNTSLFIFIILMFACHLFMPHHGSHGHNHEKQKSETNSKTHEHTH